MALIEKNIRETDKQITIKISGDLGINAAEELKAELLAIVNDPRKIRLNLKSVESFDLSTVQLLYAFMNDRKKMGFETFFETDFSHSTSLLLQHANIDFFNKE